MNRTFIPPIAVHPGKTLFETLESVRMSQTEIAGRTGLSLKTVNEIVQGKNGITADTAVKLANVFGTSAGFWNNLQRIYETALVCEQQKERLQSEVSILSKIPCCGDLTKWGYIADVKSKIEKVRELLNFFAVSSLTRVQHVEAVAFRKSQHKLVNPNPYCLAAWLRCGEIDARKVDLNKPFDRKKLESLMPHFRKLTRKGPETFVDELQNRCAECGVAVVFVPHFKNTYANGATRWLNTDNPLIQLSVRYRWEDIFWFTFFHEIGHIFLHGKKEKFVEFEGESSEVKEKEADEFAQDFFIQKADFRKFLKRQDFSTEKLIDFAEQIGVSPAIIAGRLSHETGDWTKWHNLRRRFELVKQGA